MSSRTSKKSNKKNKTKQETHKRLKRIRMNVARANQCENPLSLLVLPPPSKPCSSSSLVLETTDDDLLATFEMNFQPIDPDKEQITTHKVCIQFHKCPLREKVLESCLGLFQANMAEMYQQSSWGLNLNEKREELTHTRARYLIVTKCCKEKECSSDDSNLEGDDQDRVLAFSHFRFEVDDEDDPSQEVLYLYEIQIDSMVQRNGLGKRLMHVIELMAQQMKMRKVMLTVFKHNQNAMKFYERLNYTIDATSPSQFGENADYEILSKVVYDDESEA